MSEFWSVAVNAPLETLTYRVPHNLENLQRGQRVFVELGKRKSTGVLIKTTIPPEGIEIKDVESADLKHPCLPENYMKWLEWLSAYYFHPIGQVMELAFPPLKKTPEGKASKKLFASQSSKALPELTQEQSQVVSALKKKENFEVHLVFGVTGSGKTEIYLRLLEECLNRGKPGLVLVPEISLTPQMIQRFSSRFGDTIAVIHSHLTERQKTDQWWDVVEGRKKILIGARSALFCPVANWGLIVVDEEHEPSFKQEEKLKYQARDAAVMLGKFTNCPVILGSATPSAESWKNALEKKYTLHRLNFRVENRAFPETIVVDLKATALKEEKSEHLPFWMSQVLYEKTLEAFANKHQVAYFLNRRGVAQNVLCPLCGHVKECPNCDISLTLHGRSNLVCHYCDYHEHLELRCPSCHEGELKPIGMGTELIEKDVQSLFPQARIARADRDEIQSRKEIEDLIQRMESNEIDLLIGTQMIAKGLDFPNLNLVGLVMADVGFNLPDYRATERSFQLITQVSGRSGRHIKLGEGAGVVVVQTFNPHHPSIIFSQKLEYENFMSQELEARKCLNYPPYGRLVAFRIQGPHKEEVLKVTQVLAKRAQQLKAKVNQYQSIEVLGPAEAPLAKIRRNFRYHLLIKSPTSQILNSFCHQVLGDQEWVFNRVKISLDVDPGQLL